MQYTCRKSLLLILVFDVNCDITAGFFFSISTCISRRPGSFRVDAFRGQGGSRATRGKHSVFPKRYLMSQCIAFMSKTTTLFDGTRYRNPNLLENSLIKKEDTTCLLKCTL